MFIYQTVTAYVEAQNDGEIFTNQQIERDSCLRADQIARTLSRMTRGGTVIRIGRGLWQRPKHTRFGPIIASAERIVAVIERERRVFMTPSGAKVLNELGASAQVPLCAVFVVNQRIRPIRVGRQIIRFQYSYAFASAMKKLTRWQLERLRFSACSGTDVFWLPRVCISINHSRLVFRFPNFEFLIHKLIMTILVVVAHFLVLPPSKTRKWATSDVISLECL